VIFAQQSAAYEAVYESGVTGLVGVVSVMVVDNDGAITTAASTAGIIETPAGSGVYAAARVAPTDTGQYTVIWSIDGTFDDGTVSIEDLIVAAADGAEPLPPLPPVGIAGTPALGPCSAWTTVDAVAECCSADVGSDTSVYEDAISAATEILWLNSGRVYNGLCQDTVRPCSTQGQCGFQVLSRGHVIDGGGWAGSYWRGSSCGCRPLDEVLLPGYPVREIVEVLIDGATVDSGTYRVDDYQRLVRVRESAGDDVLFWPSCQQLDLPATETGTFAVTYIHGQDPPYTAQLAAQELACEVYKSCTTDDCALPKGTTRIVRQGIVIEKLAFSAWGLQDGIWRTGLENVDAFLNSFNPQGLRRRPVIWSPASHLQYARRVG
jgi:hypothetical protein